MGLRGSQRDRRRPDWPLRLALVALVVVWPLGLWLGATVSIARPPLKAHAATAVPPSVDGHNCFTYPSGVYPAAGDTTQGATSVYWQVYIARLAIAESCGVQGGLLGDISGALGSYNSTTGVWGPTMSIGSMTYSNALALQDLRSRVGSCNDAGTCATGDATSSLSARLRQLVRSAGSWNTATGTYDDHSGLWLLDRIEAHAATEIDRLGVVGDKLDTLHEDLRALPSTAAPATTTEPGVTQTVALSQGDRDLLTDNDGELASVLWVLVGCTIALIPAFFTVREMLT